MRTRDTNSAGGVTFPSPATAEARGVADPTKGAPGRLVHVMPIFIGGERFRWIKKERATHAG